MADSNQPLHEGASDPAEKIAQHLLRNPCDLIDTKDLSQNKCSNLTSLRVR